MNPSQNLGKSTEMLVSSMLLAENREVYLPAVDDHGVDLIVRTRDYKPGDGTTPENYEFQEIQVKSMNTDGLFAAFKCVPRANYWFVFYIRDIHKMWLVNSHDVHRLSSIVGEGHKNAGHHTFDLKPCKRTPVKKPEFLITDFSKLP